MALVYSSSNNDLALQKSVDFSYENEKIKKLSDAQFVKRDLINCESLITGDLLHVKYGTLLKVNDQKPNFVLPSRLTYLYVKNLPIPTIGIRLYADLCKSLAQRLFANGIPANLQRFVVENWVLTAETFPLGSVIPTVISTCVIHLSFLEYVLINVFEQKKQPPSFVFCVHWDENDPEKKKLFSFYMRMTAQLEQYFRAVFSFNKQRMILKGMLQEEDELIVKQYNNRLTQDERRNENYFKFLMNQFKNPIL